MQGRVWVMGTIQGNWGEPLSILASNTNLGQINISAIVGPV